MWKILNVIAILIVGGSGYVAYLNREDLMKEKDLLSRAEKYREETQAWYRKAGEVMKDRETKRDGLISDRESAEAKLDKTEKDLESTKSELATVKAQIETKQAELDAKKQTIAEYGDFEQTFAKVESLTDSIASLTESIAGMKQAKAAGIASLQNTGAKIQGYQNLELWQKTGKMKSLNANVVMVSPEFQFVIIDAGVGRGVVSRAKLDVFRGGSRIGQLTVAVIEPSRSVCNIESVVGGETIQPGDQVVVNEESKPTDKDVAGGAESAPETMPGSATAPSTPAAAETKTTAPAADEDPFGGVSTEGLDPGTDVEAPDVEAPATDDAAADPFGLN
jgi:uncharacterized protein YoxC